MNYSNDPEMVRVDFFKDSGKWGYTEAMKWDRYRTTLVTENETYIASNYEDIQGTFKRCLREQFPDRFIGLTAVCLEPYHEHAHPLMVRNWEAV